MAKKIKRQPSKEVEDVNLEQVDEERAFEVELDEEENEIVFVHHYRRKWGDGFDADVEHGLNMEEAGQLVGVMVQMMEKIHEKGMKTIPMKETPLPVEKNPLKDNPTQ